VRGKIRLKDFDPHYSDGLDKDKTKPLIEDLGRRIGDLQQLLYANSQHSVLLIFQGMDASGKDGSIRSVLQYVNPAGVEVANFKVPSDEERAHDYLWRVHKAVPRYGNIGVFNRSHYEAVVAERVLKLATKKLCSQRYEQIVAWERMLVDEGMTIVKVFLNVSKEEQRARLQERIDDPEKRWKFRMSDLDVRARFDDYIEAYDDVIEQTSTEHAPWHVVPADHNWVKATAVAELLVAALERIDPQLPEPEEGLEGLVVE